jgi:Gram-negative bacterial TonB protein C-terminal
MSTLSIYENSWINIVFENKNKEYGAYQLRQESAKTTVLAFFTGILFIALTISIPLFINYLNPQKTIQISEDVSRLIQVSSIVPIAIEKTVKPVVPQVRKQTTETITTEKQLVNPIVVASDIPTAEIAKNKENTNTTAIPNDSNATIGLNASGPTAGNGDVTSTPIDSGTSVVSTLALDKMPEFPGGINKFYNYVGNNFEKTEIESDNAIRVYVSFVIEKDGSMTDIQVKKDPGYGLGKEAIRVLKSLKTKWSPGMIAGKAVRTAYNLPITIQAN